MITLDNDNPQLRWAINLLDDGSVVTRDGEYLGTWEADENDHPSFIPDGATEELFFSPYVGMLCEQIKVWHETGSTDPDDAFGPPLGPASS